MADSKGRRDDPLIFFIFDHNMLKKEEDDLKDAILYFSPEDMPADDQCALCGQLMGMSEFLSATLSKSTPQMFRFEHRKFALKRVGAYSLGLQGGSFTPDSLLKKQLKRMYASYVTFHGSIDSLRLRFRESHNAFLLELGNIWRTILAVSDIWRFTSLTQIFGAIPYVHLPKSGAHLFLQASHLLQSCQRRPFVMAGAILYKNGVLCTQLPPALTRHLTLLQNQMPHISRTLEFDLPVGCKIVTLFLTDKQLQDITPLDPHAKRHCKVSDFRKPKHRDSPCSDVESCKNSKALARRLTCPNLGSVKDNKSGMSVSDKALNNFLKNEQRKSYQHKQEAMAVDQLPWKKTRQKVVLSHVPIVECRSGESPLEFQHEVLGHAAKNSHFGQSYTELDMSEHEKGDGEASETDNSDMDQKSHTNHINDDVLQTDPIQNHLTGDSVLDHSVRQPSVTISSVIDPTVTDNSLTDPSVTNDPEKDLVTDDSVSVTDHSVEDNSVKDNSVTGHTTTTEHSNSASETESKYSAIDINKVDTLVKTPVASDTHSNIEKERNSNSSVLELQRNLNEEEDIEPSISDLEDNDIDSGSPRRTDKASIEYERSGSFETYESGNFNLHSEQDKEIKTLESDLTELCLTESSVEVEDRRNYGQSDDRTVTVRQTADHAVLHHKADVHTEATESTEGMDKDKVVYDVEMVTDDTHRDQNKNKDIAQRKQEIHPNKVEETVKDSYISCGTHNDDSKTSKVNNNSKGAANNERPVSKNENAKSVENLDDEMKENIDPNGFEETVEESELETEDESVKIRNENPCINCLELVSDKGPASVDSTYCSQCLHKLSRSLMFGKQKDHQEVIDFREKPQSPDSGTETEDQDKDKTEKVEDPRASLVASSFSSDVSTDSTMSRYWTQEMDGLTDVTLYVQCHSDISLFLVLENPDKYQENLFHALWKGNLSQLADLDYYIKECLDVDDTDNINKQDYYKYARFDGFYNRLEGSILETQDGTLESVHQQHMLATMHSDFNQHQCLSDVVLRSQFYCCYGHQNQVDETYFQTGGPGPQKPSSGLPIPRDPVFTLDQTAKLRLAKDRKLSMI